MAKSSYLARIEGRLGPGEHLCAFYNTKEEQFQMVLPFIKVGLEKREKCLYAADENSAAEIKAGLFLMGVDVDRYLKSGQLRILTSEESYLQGGRFDADTMVSFWLSAVNESLKEGYTGLRVTGEATWVLRELKDLDEFLRYEAMLHEAVRNLPVKFLCQYNTKRFFGNVVVKVLQTHPRVMLGLDLYENPFCEPVEVPA